MNIEQKTSEDAACPLDGVVMPIVKWKTGRRNEIERIECIKETEKYVWYVRSGSKASRCDKHSQHEQFHDSWDAARDYLLKEAADKVTNARRRLEDANGFLGNVKCLKRPEGA